MYRLQCFHSLVAHIGIDQGTESVHKVFLRHVLQRCSLQEVTRQCRARFRDSLRILGVGFAPVETLGFSDWRDRFELEHNVSRQSCTCRNTSPWRERRGDTRVQAWLAFPVSPPTKILPLHPNPTDNEIVSCLSVKCDSRSLHVFHKGKRKCWPGSTRDFADKIRLASRRHAAETREPPFRKSVPWRQWAETQNHFRATPLGDEQPARGQAEGLDHLDNVVSLK
jgi:hypothetical protein